MMLGGWPGTVTADDTYWVQRISSAIPASGTSVTLGDVAPTSDRWNLAVVEVVPPQ